MNIISVNGLVKVFKTKYKEKGLKGSLKSIVKPIYKEVVAVDNLSFDIAKGEILAFIGPNGAGKSTTIKMLTGILYPTSGKVDVLGIDPTKKRKKLSFKIGTVFGQKSQLWMHLPAYDNFMFFGSIYDMSKEETEKRIKELSDVFDLGDIIDRPIKTLSLGQRMKCELAASIIHNPDILFLDEPTIGLDPVVKDSLRSLIKKMNKELGTTVFLTSHDIGDIEKLCKRVIIINHGRIVMDQSMDYLKHYYLNKKIVEIKMSDEFTFKEVQGIKILKNKGSNFKFEIDTTEKDVLDVMKEIDQDKIIDINISNVPLEEIIADIYKAGK